MSPVQRFTRPLAPGRVLPITTTATVLSSITALRNRIRSTKPAPISKGVDPEIYNRPRNFDIFPDTLNPIIASKQAVEQPIQYTLSQLKGKFQRGRREEDHIESIFVSSAKYCKQSSDPQHEFLLLEVFDSQIPEITNYLILERTVHTSTSSGLLVSTSISSCTPAKDQVRVSCYGDRELLTKQCGLRHYDVLESLEFSSPESPEQLLLCELIILAFQTSESRKMYDLMSAQCFWFSGCVWECMQALVPEALCVQVAKTNTRGRFRKIFRQAVDKTQIDDILYQTESEIRQFHMDIRRNQQAAGRARLRNEEERVDALRRENEEMRKEVERLRARTFTDIGPAAVPQLVNFDRLT